MDDFSPKLTLDTPENILLDAELAGFGTRCIAAIYDYTILLVMMIVIAILFARSTPLNADNQPRWAALYLILFALVMFYHLLFEFFWNGQTPGKRWTNIRVVRSNGMPLTASSILIRNLVRLFDFLPFFYGFGLLVLFATKQTQRLGDLAAKTVVIRERGGIQLSALKENMTVTYFYVKPIDPLPHYIRIEGLTQDDRRTVIDYLRRRFDLRERDRLAILIAQRIARKLDDPVLVADLAGSGKRAELFLEHIARAFEVAEKTGG